MSKDRLIRFIVKLNIARLTTLRDTGLGMLIDRGDILEEDKAELVTLIDERIIILGGNV